MSYTKNTWANGDVITAAKLNHIEDGIEGAGGGELIIYTVDENGATTATYNTVKSALDSGKSVAFEFDNDPDYTMELVVSVSITEGNYCASTCTNASFSNSADGYLTFD